MVTLPNSKLILCLLRGKLHGPTFSFVWNLPTNYLSIGLGALCFSLKDRKSVSLRTLRHDYSEGLTHQPI